MKKATTTTPDPEMSMPVGSGDEVNATGPGTAQPEPKQGGGVSSEEKRSGQQHADRNRKDGKEAE